MGSEKTDPLSPEAAKERLRDAAAQLGVRAWVRRNPYEALAVGFTAGIFMAASRPLRTAMTRMLIRFI